MRRNLLTSAYLAAMLAVAPTIPANASPILLGTPTYLTGIHNLSVGSGLYDVTFVDGTCASVYGSCDVAHFDFVTLSAADDAANALLSAISGSYFDTHVQGGAGCTSAPFSACFYLVAYETLIFGGADAVHARTFSNSVSGADQVVTTLAFQDDDTGVLGGRLEQGVWARFSAAAADPEPVPEPMTLSLFSAGLAGVAAMRRPKKQQTA